MASWRSPLTDSSIAAIAAVSGQRCLASPTRSCSRCRSRSFPFGNVDRVAHALAGHDGILIENGQSPTQSIRPGK